VSKEKQDYTLKILLDSFLSNLNMRQKNRERIFQNGTDFFVLGGVYSTFFNNETNVINVKHKIKFSFKYFQ
jgi:hypothetical protein